MLEKENKDLFNSLVYGYQKKAFKETNKYDDFDYFIKTICIHMQYYRDDKKNYIYFSKLYSKLRHDIESDMSARDMFCKLLSSANSIKQDIDKGLLTFEDAKKENAKIKEKDDLLLKKAFLKRIELASTWNRETLIDLEQKQFTESKKYFDYFKDNKRARGEIIGELNKGFYNASLKKLAKSIRETAGHVDDKHRFVQYMSDDLLRCKVAIMDIAHLYDEEMRKNAFVANEHHMKNKINNLGKCARQFYYNLNGKNPEEEIKENVKLLNNNVDYAQISMFDDIKPKARIKDKQ